MSKKRGRPAIYPWEDWVADGHSLRLKHGDDFNCSPKAFVVLAHREAKKRGLVARTKLAHDGMTLSLVFIK